MDFAKSAERTPKKAKIAIGILVVLLVAALGYIGWGVYQQQRYDDALGAYKQGYTQGVTDATTTLYQYTDGCGAAKLFLGNVTRQVVDLDCVKQANSTG
ncbi:MAG: hypothetical protein WCX64_01085 [Candidatus Micrarchaeia archaeon]